MKSILKRVVSLVLAVALIGLCGCVQQPGTTGSTPATNTPANTTKPGMTTNPTVTTTQPQQGEDGEWYLEKESGCNQITFYWDYTGDLANCDVWVWWDGKDGSGYLMYPCAYGGKAMINVPEGIEQVGFIVRYNCSEPGGNAWGAADKDWNEDRFAILEGTDTFIYLKKGKAAQYCSEDGGKTLSEIKKFTLAGMIDFNTIQYSLTPKVKLTSVDQIKLFDGERQIEISGVTNLNRETTTGNITVAEKLDISKVYTIEIEGYGQKNVMPTKVFDSKEFIEDYTYDGTDLGSVIRGDTTTFKVWAPTASKVMLNLYADGHTESLIESVEMVKGEKGVWSYTANCGSGTYYTYSVTTSAGTQIATDPYGKAAGLNGDRSMVIDLDSTDPSAWNSDTVYELKEYTDAVIWEVHVRDFSNTIASSQYKGKYLAFTETGLTNSAGVPIGVDYLKNLGITHVHLLPVYDYATVNEAKPDEQFNWGYDPKNYNVPEGSYSTDPYNGEVRINEFKQMVQALHNAGIGVIMDVVYNHTYDANSNLNRIVPYYYYRYTASGTNSSASGCGNDTASERYMYGKYMVDSVSYWAQEYHLDGFRFDLMGLHDLETMGEIEEAVHAINPNAIIYGEGWTMGSTIDGSAQANQGNIGKIKAYAGAAGSISVFNDAIRDGLKGSYNNGAAQGYINGNYKNSAVNVKFGIRGGIGAGPGWTVKNSAVINYMSAHDNNTLWDKLAMSNPNNTVEERMAMNRLGAAIMMIAKGTPFWQAGEEMLRTKVKEDGTFDENSYKSSDEINNINWEALVPGSHEYAMMEYYKGLIAMRKAYDIFTTGKSIEISFKDLPGGGMVVNMIDHSNQKKAVVVINPTATADTYTLTGEWNLVATGTQAGSEIMQTVTGEVTIPACSILVYVN